MDTKEKIRKIKKAMEKMEEIKNKIIKEAYEIRLSIKDGRYMLTISNEKGKNLFNKEINEYEYDKLIRDLNNYYSIWIDYNNEIMNIINKLKEKKIIEGYNIDIDFNASTFDDAKYPTAYFQVTLYISNKDILEKLEKEIKEELKEESELGDINLKFDANSITIYTGVQYGFVADKYKMYIIFVSKETAKELIKAFSK